MFDVKPWTQFFDLQGIRNVWFGSVTDHQFPGLIDAATRTLAVTRINMPPPPTGQQWSYGMSLDQYGNPWVASAGVAAMYDVAAGQWQFADTEPDDIGNYTNRAPFPTLHLIREDSLDKAVEAFPEAETIYERNIETMKKLGIAGWLALGMSHTRPKKTDGEN